jgi:hypothetical protein
MYTAGHGDGGVLGKYAEGIRRRIGGKFRNCEGGTNGELGVLCQPVADLNGLSGFCPG